MKKVSLILFTLLFLSLFLGQVFGQPKNDFSQKENEYLTILKEKPNDCDANYRLWLLYRHKAVKIILAVDNKIDDLEKVIESQEAYKIWIEKSKKYLEVAKKCKPKKLIDKGY